MGLTALLTVAATTGAKASDAIESDLTPSHKVTLAAKANEALYPAKYLSVKSNNKNCQIPPIGAISPFPIAIRLGALLSCPEPGATGRVRIRRKGT